MDRELATFFLEMFQLDVKHGGLANIRFPTFEEVLGLTDLAIMRKKAFRHFDIENRDGYFCPTPRKGKIGCLLVLRSVVISFAHGAVPEVLVLIERCQGVEIDLRCTGSEVEVADEINDAPGDG
jgi:hypothetical protein